MYKGRVGGIHSSRHVFVPLCASPIRADVNLGRHNRNGHGPPIPGRFSPVRSRKASSGAGEHGPSHQSQPCIFRRLSAAT